MALRLLANENIPGDAVEALRAAGHDVVWQHTEAPGLADLAVLARAGAEGRTIVTFDKDFGELAYRSLLPATAGIVLFRLPPLAPERVVRFVVAALTSRTDWTGHFATIELGGIRMRPFPHLPADAVAKINTLLKDISDDLALQ